MLLTAVVYTSPSEKLPLRGRTKVPFLYKCPNNQMSFNHIYIYEILVLLVLLQIIQIQVMIVYIFVHVSVACFPPT